MIPVRGARRYFFRLNIYSRIAIMIMNKSNFENEKLVESQLWLPHLKPKPIRAADFFDEVTAPASRYRSLLSGREKLSLSFKQKITAFSEIGDYFNLRNSLDRIPLRWQIIVNYLYEAGLIASPKIIFEPLFNDEPKTNYLCLPLSSIENLTDGNSHLNHSSFGVSRDVNEAISKAVGELLERYTLTIYRTAELLQASIDDLENKNFHFLNPFWAATFSEAQKQKFPNRCFDDKSVFRWAEGKSLMTGGRAFIPAQMVFWNYNLAPNEPYIQQSTTNGSGGMFTLEEAIISGLYELIERDAFLLYWLNGIAPRRIRKDSFKNPKFQELLHDIERYNIRVEILDITSDLGIPVLAAALLDRGKQGPAVILASSCGPDPEVLVARIVNEALLVRHLQRRRMELPYPELPEFYEPFSLPIGHLDRVKLWANPKMINKIDFFLNGPIVSIEECHPHFNIPANPSDKLSKLAEIFSKKGEEYEIFYYEAKHTALETLGYHSVSVNVPALIPLYLHETSALLGAKRIREACLNLGYKPPGAMNSIPHPFP